MSQTTRLFAVTSWLLTAGFIFCLGITALLVLALGAIELASIGLFHFPDMGIDTQGTGLVAAWQMASVAIMGAALCMALYAAVLFLIGRIVASAMAGDPFVLKNANRLNVVGWVMLALQAVGLVTHLLIAMMPYPVRQHLHFGFGASMSGLFAALLVFVLAQIFRHGSQMRAELEGTV